MEIKRDRYLNKLTSFMWDGQVKVITGIRPLEDDELDIYGTFAGDYTYETVMGASVTIPSLMGTDVVIK
jgi:hypothetical protein